MLIGKNDPSYEICTILRVQAVSESTSNKIILKILTQTVLEKRRNRVLFKLLYEICYFVTKGWIVSYLKKEHHQNFGVLRDISWRLSYTKSEKDIVSSVKKKKSSSSILFEFLPIATAFELYTWFRRIIVHRSM